MFSIQPQIEESWKVILKDEFQKEYFTELTRGKILENNS